MYSYDDCFVASATGLYRYPQILLIALTTSLGRADQFLLVCVAIKGLLVVLPSKKNLPSIAFSQGS